MSAVGSKPPYTIDDDPETAIEPDLLICDAHHHLWGPDGLIPYSVADFARDTSAGHRIETSMYLEFDQGYRDDGPVEFRPVGETELAARFAENSRDAGGAEVVGIIPFIDPRIGDATDEVAAAHIDAGKGLVRGFRARVGYDPKRIYIPEGHAQWPGQMADAGFRRGVQQLGRRNLPLDLLLYHSQLEELRDLIKASPDTVFVINHLAFPILIGGYGERPDEVFANWRAGLDDLAELPNVIMKIGGFGMRLFGHGWTERDHPATSDEIVERIAPWVEYAIETFGPSRSIFESNFPVDGWAFGYVTLWNAFKKLSASYSADERAALFRETAVRTYGLPALVDSGVSYE